MIPPPPAGGFIETYGAFALIAAIAVISAGVQLTIFLVSRGTAKRKDEAETLNFLAKAQTTIIADLTTANDAMLSHITELEKENQDLREFITETWDPD